MRGIKARLSRYLLGGLLVLLFLGHGAQVWRIPLLEVLDAYFYDVRVRLSAPGGGDDRVAIIDLDERSLAAEGRWPWSRDKVAELVRRLVDDHGVAVLGFDVVFAEPDESSGIRVLEALAQGRLRDNRTYQESLRGLRSQLDFDGRLAQTLKGRPVVLGFYFSAQEGMPTTGALPPPVLPPGSFAGIATAFTRWQSYGANLPALQAAAAGGGHFNPLVDFDGVSRRVPLLVEYQGAYYEALALAVLRAYFGEITLRPGIPDPAAGMEWLDLVSAAGTYRIPVDERAAVLIPYRGPARSFTYISATDILKGRVPVGQLRGRIALLGTSAPGLMDLRVTPVGSAYPGVEIHANLIAGILDRNIRERPPYILGVEVALLLLSGGLLAFLLPRLSPWPASFLAMGMLLAVIGINFSLWHGAGLVLPLAATVSMILLLYGMDMAWGYFVEARSKRQFTELFGQYVPPELVDEMARNPEAYSMEGRNETLTVLFSDVRNFTHLSEGMNPRELVALMNEYLGAMTQIIRRYRGTLDKYIGDAIMAFWGAPVANPDHARHAVLAALEMQTALRLLDEPFKARGWPPLTIGVGINTGVMTVGDMGSPVRKAYTVMGDAVNLASRLEGLTKVYGVGIIVGEATRAELPDMAFRELDRVRVKGKDRGVSIYEPLGSRASLGPEALSALESWQQVLTRYHQQAWDQAEAQLLSLENTAPAYAALCRLYRDRIAHLRQDPPGPEWDGVTTYQAK
ncbi:MAG: adenylate/guanylate cyclase domain-containing protein [Azovibrio sp.]|uniref:CHASE2 domain-containing protein n=1 Tax=Azovibrio sp. TaxID=1872673 RepID=UPI003C793E68